MSCADQVWKRLSEAAVRILRAVLGHVAGGGEILEGSDRFKALLAGSVEHVSYRRCVDRFEAVDGAGLGSRLGASLPS